jgi:NAD(P)-dependent dehydrogenase (short-subunit alcohol dehydrogenase family)
MTNTALITGSSAGLGFETAKGLLRIGFTVVLTGRDELKLERAAATLRAEFGGEKAAFIPLDLASLQSLPPFVTQLENLAPIDLLVLNAGAKIERPMKLTEDGFEWHLGVNHLAHFALVADVWHTLAPSAHVVSVASVVARRGNLSAIFEPRSLEFSAGQAYANSKLANLAFALELDARARKHGVGVRATAAHPGFARASAYGSRLVRFGEYLAAQSARSGAKPLVEASFADGGSYLGPRVFELWGSPKAALVPAQAKQSAERDRFWAESERLTGRKLLS